MLRHSSFKLLSKKNIIRGKEIKSLSVLARRYLSTNNTPHEETINVLPKNNLNALEFIHLPKESLKPGYQVLQQKLIDTVSHIVKAAIISPSFSAIWLIATDQMLLDSPVAITSLLVGGMTISNRLFQMSHVKKYARLSVLSSSDSVAHSEEDNKKIEQIISGVNPLVKFNATGLDISGILGDPSNPSKTLVEEKLKIQQMTRIVLPDIVLDEQLSDRVNNAHERWISRLMMPINMMNIVAIMNKDSKDRFVDDYVVLASATYNIYDYLSGPSLREARENITKMLLHSKTPHDVIKVLVDKQLLDEGGMSFLNEWVKNKSSIGVKVGRTGSVILYSGYRFTMGGPYPAKFFPQPKLKLDEEQGNQENNLQMKRR